MSPAHPIPGAGVVVWRGEEVLLIRRGRRPHAGQWSIPGGKIKIGETAAAAALRELLEETGVTARIVGLIDIVDAIDADNHYLLVDFAAEWVSGEPVAGDDALEAEFVDLRTALERLAWDQTRRVLDASRELIPALKRSKLSG